MKKEIAVLGGGCFWCLEAAFQQLKGVLSVTSGYAGGKTVDPTYEQVCSGKTGHAEVVRLEFDEDVVSFESLLTVFFTVHDPTTLNRQGNDVGTQYRSIIFFSTEVQKSKAEKFIHQLVEDKVFDDPIVTEIKPLEILYLAESYHQNYYQHNSQQAYCRLVINPKLKKLQERYRSLLKN